MTEPIPAAPIHPGGRAAPPDAFDVAVIGAGVVGCAVARRFAHAGHRVAVIEKGDDILSGASKANSAILHTGFDAPPGSLELACMQRGYAEYMALRDALNLPVLETGAMVVAWTPEDEARLPALAEQAHSNGVDDARLIGADAVRAREPRLAASARAALLVPREHVIDPWSPFLAYAGEVVRRQGRFLFDTEVTGGGFDGTAWSLDVATDGAARRVRAGTVINCAGLFGDVVEARLLGAASFAIKPRKGQFVVYDKAAAGLLTTTILPVPNERTKGVVLCRTAFGNLLVGPTAEEQEDRGAATVTTAELHALMARAAAMVPALADMPVTAVYAGLRPATEKKHYRVRHHPDRHWVTVGGIRSTGLTAALGLASHVEELVEGRPATALRPDPVAMPNLAQHRPRDWQRPGYGEIVCHCEMVTRREIEAALAGPLPPRSLGGLKRRTRAAMGRCQGFNCASALAAIAGNRFG